MHPRQKSSNHYFYCEKSYFGQIRLTGEFSLHILRPQKINIGFIIKEKSEK